MSQSTYANIATKVRKAYKLQDKDLLEEALLELLHRFEAYQAALEVGNKKCCPLKDRYLEVMNTESSSTSKLTVNPVDGRFTLKISKKASEAVSVQFIKLVEVLMAKEDLPAIALRGKIEFYRGGYQCHLLSASRKVKYFIRMEEENA